MKKFAARSRSNAILLATALAFQGAAPSYAAPATFRGSSAGANAPATTAPTASSPAGGLFSPPRTSSANVETYELPLAQLAGKAEPMTLKGPAPEIALALPLPALLEPVDVTLNLSGSASHALIDSSQLVVKANGRVVEQIRLKDDNANFRRSISIPRAALKEGMNDIRLTAAQRSHPAQTSCDADAAPELWTQIDMRQSGFVINARPRNVPLSLDAMDALFDRASLQTRPVIPFFTPGKPDAAATRALGIAAQGLGRRYGNTPVAIHHGVLPDDPRNLASLLPKDTRGAVIVGTFAELAPYLGGVALPEKSRPMIAVRPMPGDATRFMLIMAAENAADLSEVAMAFSVPGMPWPDEPSMQVSRLEMPGVEAAQHVIEAPADPAATFPLRALQYRTSTFTGKHAPETALKVWNNNWQGRLLVQVHLSYASGMSPQSALNVLTNGVQHGSIPLSSPAGGNYFNYAVTVPAGSLKLGWNTLQFQPVLIPEGSGQGCKPQAEETLAVTLYDDTTVQKYEGVPSKQPDLALLSGLGRAYADNKTPPGVAVHLTDTDSQTMGAGLTLLAKMAQVQQGPLQPAWFGVGDSPAVHNHIWVGANARLPAAVKRSVSPDGPQQVAVQLPLVESSLISRADRSDWMAILKDNLGYSVEKAPAYTSANLNVASAMGKKSVAYTSRSNGVSTTVFTADNNIALAAGIDSITTPQQWGQLRGSFASWTPGAPDVDTVSAEEAPFQAYGLRGGLAMLVSRYPWLALLALGLAILLLVPFTAKVLRGYRKRKHGSHEQ